MRAIGIVVVIGLVILVVGLFAGWFSITKERTEDETRIGLEVHKDVVEDDLDDAKQKMKDLGSGIKEAVSGDPDESAVEKATAKGPLAGTLESVDAASRRLTLRASDDEFHTVELEPGAALELDGVSTTLDALLPGDRVVVHWKLGETARATKVIAVRGS